MLKITGIFISIFLIIIIFLRIPDKDMGLANSTSKKNFLGSPSSTQRFLNFITVVGIFIYLGIAIQLNLTIA